MADAQYYQSSWWGEVDHHAVHTPRGVPPSSTARRTRKPCGSGLLLENLVGFLEHDFSQFSLPLLPFLLVDAVLRGVQVGLDVLLALRLADVPIGSAFDLQDALLHFWLDGPVRIRRLGVDGPCHVLNVHGGLLVGPG